MQLVASNITAGYGAREVLKGVTISVKAGEFVGLVGANGCGKSTLLKVLSRTMRPGTGTVELGAESLYSQPPRLVAQRIAFVPQQEVTAFDFLVRDVVLMGRYPHHKAHQGDTTEDFELSDSAMLKADIAHLADRPITQLSGGEYRRVLLARALAQTAPLLLLDEPTAHLDITHQTALMILLRQLVVEQNVGVLAALHDLPFAAEYCDRMVLMSDGKILADGTPEQVLTPALLKIAYGADAKIGPNPVTGKPLIFSIVPL